MTEKLVFWLDRECIVHEGRHPRGPDDYLCYTTCGEHEIRKLHIAIGYQAPTCLKCATRQPRS